MKQTRRSAICELHLAGHTPLKIIKLLKYSRQTVYDVCKRFDEMGKEQRSAHNLNPLDYYFWSRIQAIACKKHHNNLNSLKMSIKRAINTLEKEEIVRALSKF